MKESATSTMAMVPIANVSGAAGPAACTTKVILKAAVIVGEMTARDNPTHSGRLKRDINLAMSSHHIMKGEAARSAAARCRLAKLFVDLQIQRGRVPIRLVGETDDRHQ